MHAMHRANVAFGPRLKPSHSRIVGASHRTTPCQVSQAGEPSTAVTTTSSGRARVMELLAAGQSHYNHGPELGEAIELMITENPTAQPGLAIEQGLGTGTWQVFWAPHISSLSSTLLATRFEPILYKFYPDGRLVSNVQYNGPLVGQGWLSSSGRMFRKFDDTVEISFDKFWVDMGPLREELTEEQTTKVLGLDINADAVMSAVGRAGFFPQFAVFPVAYYDQDLAVFEFPPLRSKIAIRRLPSEDKTNDLSPGLQK